jgi:hypothetical protein
MTGLQLVLLAWGLAIIGIWALVHGSKLNDGGHKARMDAERRKEWITRMDVERVQ